MHVLNFELNDNNIIYVAVALCKFNARSTTHVTINFDKDFWHERQSRAAMAVDIGHIIILIPARLSTKSRKSKRPDYTLTLHVYNIELLFTHE